MFKRSYVKAIVSWDEQGNATPLSIELHGVVYHVDRLLEPPRHAHATKAGGVGMRYRVRIRGTETYIYMDERHRWFVEEKVQQPFDRSISLPGRRV